MAFEFAGEVWYWKGPAPFYFVTVPAEESLEIKSVEKRVSYGWGMIPVEVLIGASRWTTALWPKDGKYILPLKDRVRKNESIHEGDTVHVEMQLRLD